MNYIQLEEVPKSAVWFSSSLSAAHYVRDFREQKKNLRAMGPIIATQKVVGAVPTLSPARTSANSELPLIFDGDSLSEGN